ncbi:hypothetical protein NURINAE_00245 [Candidatus Nitrosacidococcus sp. I8]|nr:hypothetical protein NURINAE_00245 [Candidatus Nitrosacidococcus sp. I8]
MSFMKKLIFIVTISFFCLYAKTQQNMTEIINEKQGLVTLTGLSSPEKNDELY